MGQKSTPLVGRVFGLFLEMLGYEKISSKRETVELLPFSRENPSCDKCGSSNVTTEFRHRGDLDSWPFRKFKGVTRDHLERLCRNCGWVWIEHTQDQYQIIDVEFTTDKHVM